jgi:hypothetical protein
MAEGTVEQVIAGEATWCVHHGDCLDLLRSLPDCSVDALVTDPPAGVAFMSKSWDKDRGGRDEWIRWLAEIMREAWRVMKPGAHGFVWALPRTSHWTAMALEDAGFEIRDSFHHLFSTGFPKSLAADKAIDAKLGAERRVVGTKVDIKTGLPMSLKQARRGRPGLSSEGWERPSANDPDVLAANIAVTAPGTPEAAKWSGWGTAVKPAHEVWWLIRKPLEGTLAENLMKWGVGAINIDGCRITTSDSTVRPSGGMLGIMNDDGWEPKIGMVTGGDQGRFPANLLLSHHPDCVKSGVATVPAHPTWDTPNRATEPSAFTGNEVSKVRHANGRDGEASAEKRYADRGSTEFAPLPGARRDDTEAVDVWDCVDGCAVAALGSQSGERTSGFMAAGTPRGSSSACYGKMPGAANPTDTYADAGSAARFFPQFHEHELDDLTPYLYVPKPARSEKDAGLEHFRARSGAEATDSEDGQARLESPRSGAGRKGGARNVHPTVKGIELMRYLTKLITPPKGTVVDLFAGSGTSGVAAVIDGFRWVGAEMNDSDEDPSVSTARARLHHVEGREFIPRPSLRAAEPPKQTALFAASAEQGRMGVGR